MEAKILNISGFLDITPCSLVMYQDFGLHCEFLSGQVVIFIVTNLRNKNVTKNQNLTT